MSASLDTSGLRPDVTGGGLGGMPPIDDPCGAGLDWRNGVEGLRRSIAQSATPTDAVLASVIERDIIPRLMLAQEAAPRREARARGALDIRDSTAFARFVLASDPPTIIDQIELLLENGIRLQRIYTDLLAPVARKLGELWEQDRCTFVEVTIGLSRLQQVLHEVARRGTRTPQRHKVPRIYLVPVPGEQHTFGLSMVEEFFLHAGWETACDHAASAETILQTVSRKALDVIGFTIGTDTFFEPMVRLVESVRPIAERRGITILVGGKFLHDHPHLAGQLPGTTLVLDGVSAVGIAEELIARSPREIGSLAAPQTGP
ncbi:cobalamin B12-binding domain-containing protein [Zavarzinia sp. CC-PAN008]|uniref:cobalamin B12-binding domain-containing protein n=1 Tax=Zavarzinia sp. CC-PAN008 TaxID=3243332 RepID=UPI003F744255